MDNSPYQKHSFHGGEGGIPRELICKNTKIVIPNLLQKHVIDWYHTVLCHPAMNWTKETISQHLWWPKKQEQITAFVQACPCCQKYKRKQKKYRHLPPKVAEAQIW